MIARYKKFCETRYEDLKNDSKNGNIVIALNKIAINGFPFEFRSTISNQR